MDKEKLDSIVKEAIELACTKYPLPQVIAEVAQRCYEEGLNDCRNKQIQDADSYLEMLFFGAKP